MNPDQIAPKGQKQHYIRDMNPDQTGPFRAGYYGSILFAIYAKKVYVISFYEL